MSPSRPIRLLVLLAVVGVLLATGCVRRRMTIRSNPPGAAVFIDNQQIGTTPVSTGFTYYGTRTITLVKDGYETQTVQHTFETPWYQVPPLDFVSENINPNEIRDQRDLDFTLVPQQMVPSDQVWRNAENLRRSAQQGFVAPLPRAGAVLTQPESVPAPAPLPAPPATSNIGHRGLWR